MVLFPSPSVSTTHVKRGMILIWSCFADTVDQILARLNDAGGFDEIETVWLLSA